MGEFFLAPSHHVRLLLHILVTTKLASRLALFLGTLKPTSTVNMM